MKVSMKSVLIVLAFLFPLLVNAEAQPTAAQLYSQQCAVCHGEQGDGMSRARRGLNPPPRDFTTAVAAVELTRERMINSITHGRQGTAMVSFASRLTADQIAEIADYIRERFMSSSPSLSTESLQQAAYFEKGQRLFVSNCAVCHGDNGSGAMWTQFSLNPPPRDFTSPQSRAELSRERMITSVTHGRPGTAMMAFNTRLSKDEIDAVVDFVRVKFISPNTAAASSHGHAAAQTSAPHHGHATPQRPAHGQNRTHAAPQTAAVDMSAPFPHGLQGDVEWGRKFYMENCSACHGAEGDGKGPRSKFINPRPRNFNLEESRQTFNRIRLYRSISRGKAGTPMPAWGKVLSDQELANVAEFVFQRFILEDETAGTKKKASG